MLSTRSGRPATPRRRGGPAVCHARVEIGSGSDDLQSATAFRAERRDAPKAQQPADRTDGLVLYRPIEAVHENRRGKLRRRDFGKSGRQQYVDDSHIGAVAL